MEHDAIVIGSGFGGTLAAHELVHAGWKVLMLERGPWVARGPENWAPEAVGYLGPYYSTDTPYRVLAGGERDTMGSFQCVGGQSVFYGGASPRFRAEDFEPAPEIVGDTAARWPFAYEELEPHYTGAERIIGVAGEPGLDPTEPFRSAPYPQSPGALSPMARRVWDAARSLGLRPFRLPLALNHARRSGRAPCVACPTCDGFACAIGAKNDLATAVLPGLLRRGLRLEAETVAVRLVARGRRLTGVECVELRSGRRVHHTARVFVLAAGALASPHLVLASGLERLSPAGWTVGRYLTRHYNALVMGVFPGRPDPEEEFHKQVGIHDFYFGHPTIARPAGKLGAIQQRATPPAALVRALAPRLVRGFAARAVPHVTGLLVIAEDQPQRDNGVGIEARRIDRFGLPQLLVTHRYSRRDLEAGGALVARAREILRRAGAWLTYVYPIRSFSHAVGTLRMGTDANSSTLDPWCRFRGTENLYVADASAFPTSGGVNPSLTIAACALRLGAHLAGEVPAGLTGTEAPLGRPS